MIRPAMAVSFLSSTDILMARQVTGSVQLSCPACGFASVCGPSAMIVWLRQAKMVRRDAEPEVDLLAELFRATAEKFVCPECGATGLTVQPVTEESEEDWGMARRCGECGQAIPRERLEIFPAAKYCVSCQSRSDSGGLSATPEYCPRCGNVLTLRQSRAPGITRYVMACPVCKR